MLPFVIFTLAGFSALLAAMLPRILRGRPFSLPLAFLLVGVGLGFLPVLPALRPLDHGVVVEHATEVVVIIALMGAGLAIDRPFGWRRWASAWRLIAVAMPLTIALVAVTGSVLGGLPLAAAVLLGAVMAPTDPVLAGDVQVGQPGDGTREAEARFAITAEAGLNDGAAFPAVYLALALAAAGGWGGWLVGWALVDVVVRSVIGVAIGLALGWGLGWLFLRVRRGFWRLPENVEGFSALSVTFLAYGLTQLATGYGFVAVFVAACAIRSVERSHRAHQVAHGFVEQVERRFTAWLVLLLGVTIADGLLAELTWGLAAVGALLVLVVRPVVGWVSLLGTAGGRRERVVIAFFGVRGVGSLYYLSYALENGEFPGPQLWSAVGFAVTLSVVVHGLTATPVVRWLDAARERRLAENRASGTGDVAVEDVRV